MATRWRRPSPTTLGVDELKLGEEFIRKSTRRRAAQSGVAVSLYNNYLSSAFGLCTSFAFYAVKKYLLALTGLLPLAAQAQFGVRAGVHSTQWASSGRFGAHSASTRQHLGYQVGVNYQVPLGGHLSLLPELK